MAAIRWLVGGLIGGATGVVIWVLIGYFAHYEVGWIAWGVGFLTGLGVRYAAYLNGEEASLCKRNLRVPDGYWGHSSSQVSRIRPFGGREGRRTSGPGGESDPL